MELPIREEKRTSSFRRKLKQTLQNLKKIKEKLKKKKNK